MQSDSDSSRPKTPSGVAKPPGAQIRCELKSVTYRFKHLTQFGGCSLQAESGWFAGFEAQFYTRCWCRRFIQHHAQVVHGRLTRTSSVRVLSFSSHTPKYLLVRALHSWMKANGSFYLVTLSSSSSSLSPSSRPSSSSTSPPRLSVHLRNKLRLNGFHTLAYLGLGVELVSLSAAHGQEGPPCPAC